MDFELSMQFEMCELHQNGVSKKSTIAQDTTGRYIGFVAQNLGISTGGGCRKCRITNVTDDETRLNVTNRELYCIYRHAHQMQIIKRGRGRRSSLLISRAQHDIAV